jgi:hypothetical protein
MMKIAATVAIVLLNPKFSLSPDTSGGGGATFTFESFIFMILDDTRRPKAASTGFSASGRFAGMAGLFRHQKLARRAASADLPS